MKKGASDGTEGGLAFTIGQRLERRFGTGQDPQARRRLYARLQLAVEVHGERAYRALCTVAAEAESARAPDRYFCFSATRRLAELGLMPRAEL